MQIEDAEWKTIHGSVLASAYRHAAPGSVLQLRYQDKAMLGRPDVFVGVSSEMLSAFVDGANVDIVIAALTAGEHGGLVSLRSWDLGIEG